LLDRDSGQVCVEAQGTYIAVAASYWDTYMRRQGIDTASLDLAGGDASTYAAWHFGWLREAYRSTGPVKPVRVQVEFTDIAPARWLMAADSEALRIDELPEGAGPVDVSITIGFASWQAMLRERSDPCGALDRSGGRLVGDRSALERFVSQLPESTERAADDD
jgi:hypothetical protein